MSLNELLVRLESASSGDRAPILAALSDSETLPRLVEEVVGWFGRDASKALPLADLWPDLEKRGGDKAYTRRLAALGAWIRGDYANSARRFLQSSEFSSDASQRARFLLGAIDALARSGSVERALRLGASLAAEFDALGEPVQAGRTWVNVGNASTQADRHPAARNAFQIAIERLEGADRTYELAAAKIGLSSVALAVGDPEEAIRHAESALFLLREIDEQDSVHLAEANLGLAYAQKGLLPRAIEVLSGVLDRLPESSAERGRVSELIGDAFLEINRLREAQTSYEEALSWAGKGANPRRANAAFGLATVLRRLRMPEWLKFEEIASRAYSRIGNRPMLAETKLLLAAEALDFRQFGAARRYARAALVILGRDRAPRTRIKALLILSEAELELGESPTNLPTAARLIERHGAIGFAWKADYLSALAKPEARRGPYFRKMFERIIEVRLLSNSSLGRMNFLDDKMSAIQAYLDWLYQKGAEKNLAEIIDVVARTRSATLIDEILAARAEGALRAELGALRERIRIEVDAPDDGAGFRLNRRRAKLDRKLLRDWGLLRNRLDYQIDEEKREARPPIGVLLGGRYRLLGADKRDPGLERSELETLIANFQFEAMEPLISPEASPKRAMTALAELRKVCEVRDLERLCPAPQLWSAPWQILRDENEELVLQLSPVLAPSLSDFRLGENPKVGIWIGPELSCAETEAAELIRRFPGAHVARTIADARRMFGEKFDLFHVAAHARHDPNEPMLSSILLEDGSISAAELAIEGPICRAAILLGCSSGRLSSASSTEVDGLIRAFLARSAEFVIGSAWELSDVASEIFSGRFYAEMQRGASVLSALSLGRQAIREKFPHPFYWGSPILFGGYAKSPPT